MIITHHFDVGENVVIDFYLGQYLAFWILIAS